MHGEKYKIKRGPTESRTRVPGIRILCDNHYTMEPYAYFILSLEFIAFEDNILL